MKRNWRSNFISRYDDKICNRTKDV